MPVPMPKTKSESTAAQKHDRNMRPQKGNCEGLTWHDPRGAKCALPLQVAGLAWFERDRAWRRMPVAPKHKLPEAVDNLANCTAGAQIRFQSDTTRVAVRVKLPRVANMVHMATTGISGVDCYAGPAGTGRGLRYYGTTKFDMTKTEYEILLFEHSEALMRNFTLYLPLYSGVRSVEVAVEPDAKVLPPPKWNVAGPLVVYGTSITHGGCASRTGMAYPAILGRAMNAEFYNLGFSGSGRGEPEVARTIAEIRAPALIALDYEANSGGIKGLSATLPGFIRILREEHPKVPLLVLSRIRFAHETLQSESLRARNECLSYQRQVVSDLHKAGDANIHFQDGTDLLGRDYEECTVDGVHPTDLGFYRMAEALLPVFRRILGAGQ